MRVTVVGAGYVGLVTGLTLAEQGHSVTLLDTDHKKIAYLRQGVAPIYEPDLPELLTAQRSAGRVSFTTRYEEAIPEREFVFLCVGTPSDAEGATDLQYLKTALEAMRPHLHVDATVVIKSTVPVGTNRWALQLLTERESQGTVAGDVVSNPEFLREGSAVWDSRNPDRIVVGARNSGSFERMKALYTGFKAPILQVTPEEAELIKYTANAFLAMKLSFVNTVADLCDAHNADVRKVALGIGLDSRIGPRFLAAGLGFGGSCFPKDVRSFIHQLRSAGVATTLLDEVLRINEARVTRAVGKLQAALGPLAGRRIALLGLAFKPHTDDVRESQSIRLMEALLRRSAQVTAYDPRAMENAAKRVPDASYAPSALDACAGADAVIVATEWPEFVNLPWDRVFAKMRRRVVLDARNCLDRDAIVRRGGTYLSLGVPATRAVKRQSDPAREGTVDERSLGDA